MQQLFKLLFLVCLTSSIALSTVFSSPGAGALTALAALVLAALIKHKTKRAELFRLVSAPTAFAFAGMAYFFTRDLGATIFCMLWTATGLVELILSAISCILREPSVEIGEGQTLVVVRLKNRWRNKDGHQAAEVQVPFSLRRGLQISFWLCAAICLVALFALPKVTPALALNALTLALTFSYDGRNFNRMRASCVWLALLCLIGVIQTKINLGPLPLIVFCMSGLMALLCGRQ